jgi:hypothetical protein
MPCPQWAVLACISGHGLQAAIIRTWIAVETSASVCRLLGECEQVLSRVDQGPQRFAVGQGNGDVKTLGP